MKIKSLIRKFLGCNVQPVYTNIVTLAPNKLLEERTALITGGSSGIGCAIAEAMVNAGASVVITGRNEKKLEIAINKLKPLLNGCQKAVYECMDNADIASMQQHWQNILSKLDENNRIDILVNNAGINSMTERWGHSSEKDFDAIISTNLKGTYFFSDIIAHYMVSNKIQGNILNIASSSSLRPGNSAYILSKWGVKSLTMGMAKALIPHGIVVNGLAPGPTATPMLNKNSNDNISLPCNPLGRYALPEEIANMAVVLTSNIGRTIVGDIIYMTGGAGVLSFDDANYSF